MSNDRMHIGASWYPEMWPVEEWAADVDRMKALGFNLVRVFEFAWRRFEPREGEYEFEWAKVVLDLCHQAGINVIVGTPTAAPPAWVTTKYPEVLGTKPGGVRQTHGKRKHYNHHSAKYRDLSAKIVEQMCRAFADHPAVMGWQIDNEMSGYDYGDETLRRFHEWLADRYGSIDNLNETWGLNFWSQWYDSFDQVPLVTARVGTTEVPERHHPSLIMAIARFQNDGWTEFIAAQCEIIRKHTDRPITSNMTDSPGMHWYRHNKLLDRVGHSLYKDLDHYKWNLRSFDRMRAEKDKPYWFLETAPNWSGGGRMWNIHHSGDGVRAVTWMSAMLGGDLICYWQWRQHWAGQEMNHGTHVTATGKWRPGKEAWTKIAAEWAEQSDWLLANPPAQAPVALMESNLAAWCWSIDPLDNDMVYRDNFRDAFHLPLAEQHIWRDIIDPSADLSRYKVLLMPLMPIVPEELKRRLVPWVEAGGRLLLGPVTGTRTEEFTTWTDREFGGLEELMGGRSAVRFPAIWVEDRISVDFDDASASRTRAWCEGFEADAAETIASYSGGYGDGAAAVLHNRVGDGSVITLGCLLDRDCLLRTLGRLLDAAGVEPVAGGSPDVLVVPRGGTWDAPAGYAVLNYTERPQSVTLPAGGTDRLTGRAIDPEINLQPLEAMLIEVGR